MAGYGGKNGRTNVSHALPSKAKDAPFSRPLVHQIADRFFGDPGIDVQNPSLWAKDKAKIHLWSMQSQIAESVKENRYTAVPSCHDAGKSFVAATIAAWWLDTHPIGEAFVVSTAPSAPQVSAILWREIERLHRRADLEGQINMGAIPEWKVGKELIGYGRKPADYNADTGFQGIHSKYPLIIVDEAAGIPRSLWDAIDALATNDNARVLAIGNPDNSASHFFKICEEDSGWNVIHLDGLLTPNFTEDEVKRVSALPDCGDLYQFMVDHGVPFSTEEVPDELRTNLLGVRWVGERMKRWGVHQQPVLDEETGEIRFEWKTSALWEAKVRGRFAENDSDALIPMAWVKAAIERWYAWRDSGGVIDYVNGHRIYGVDVARYGDDETCIVQRQGDVLYSIDRVGKQDTMTTANKVAALLRYPQSIAIVDVIGVGAGVVDRLRELRQTVIPYNASERSTEKDATGEFTFVNHRSATWWKLREMLDPSRPGGATIMLPDDDQMIADLTAPLWKVQQGARIAIESKDEIKRRLGRSPDTGDAVVIAFSAHREARPGEAVYAGWADVPDTWDELILHWEDV